MIIHQFDDMIQNHPDVLQLLARDGHISATIASVPPIAHAEGAVNILRLLLEGHVSTVAHLRRRPRHNALQDVALRQPLA